MSRLSVVWIALFVSCLRLGAQPPCIAGSLSSYQALLLGCTVGPLTVSNFSFSVVSSSGGPTLLTPSGINVTPLLGPSIGLVFSSGGFQVTSTQSVEYSLGYTWDPTPDIRGLGDILDPPFGAASVKTDGCVNSPFVVGICPTSTVTLNVSPSQLTDFVTIPPPDPVLGIVNDISLNPGGGTAGGFDSITNFVTVPEPAAFGVLAVGLGLLALKVRLRRA